MTEVEITAHVSHSADKLNLSGLNHTELTRLYCMNGGHHLQLLPEGSVRGSREEHDPYSVLRITAVSAGVVVIEGTQAKRFLSMSDDGKLYGSLTVTDESHFLEELEENNYNTYKSQKYGPNWYVGIKKERETKARLEDTHWTTGHFLSTSAGGSRKGLKYALTDVFRLTSITQNIDEICLISCDSCISVL